MKHKCYFCQKLSNNTQKVNGSPYHCYDGCYSTTGRDMRTTDGKPAWENGWKNLIDENLVGAVGQLNRRK